MIQIRRRGQESPGVTGASEPTDLLLACHERIRSYCVVACRLADGGASPSGEIVEAAASLLRYFEVALPLHEADEEQSVAPRLLASVAAGDVTGALSQMASQHLEIHGILADLRPLWGRLASEPAALSMFAEGLRDHAAALRALFERHLLLEESVIFPAIQRALSANVRSSILREFVERRSVPPSWA